MDPVYRREVFPEDPDLRNERVVLRKWMYDDLPCIEEASQDPVIPNGTTVPTRFSDSEGRAFIERQWGRATSGEGLSLAVVDVDSGTATGLICLLHRQQRGLVGVGYWTVASSRGRGLAREGLILLSRWALGLSAVSRLEALVAPENRGSVRVLEGAGFQREGTLRGFFSAGGTHSDAVLYSLVPSDLD